MYVLMRCVAEAVVARGVRGLAELVPGGTFLYDVANEAHRRLRDRRRTDQIREEVVAVAAAGIDEVRKVAEQVVREVAKNAAPAEKAALELYLTQVPGAVRSSLRRADDPSGRSVPDQFRLADGADLARRLPSRLPKFRAGEPLPGRPGWVLGELLGSGGFGEVWLVQNPSLAALKGAVKLGTDPQARERLLRHEGGLVSRVMEAGRHPNIVPLLDAYLQGDTPWLMYEYVSGGELGTLIGTWAPADRVAKAVAALRTLAAAVGHFHRLSPPLVHRDLKPANILVRGKAANPQLLVADFGIGGVAAAAALAAETARRSSGYLGSQLWGSHTPLYAGPQQQRGEKPDPRDDVHALGVIGYQMLTGKLDAAPGADFARTLKRLNVPEPLIELLGDCAAHDPAHRPKDAAELADRLAKLDRPGAAAPPAAEPRVVACPSCGVSLRFRAGATALRCTRCGAMFDPPAVAAPPPPPKAERTRETKRTRVRATVARDRFNPMWVAGGAAAAVFVIALMFLVRGRGAPPGGPGSPGGAPIRHVRDFEYAKAAGARLFRHTPDGTALLVADDYGFVAVVGLNGKERLRLDVPVRGSRPALFPDGARLAAAALVDGRVYPSVVPLADGGANATALVGLGLESPTALAVSPNGTWVAAGGSGGSVMMWNVAAPTKGNALRIDGTPPHRGGGTTALAFSPDGKHLISAGADEVVRWDVSPEWTGSSARTTATSVFDVGVTADGKKLVAGVHDRGMRVWYLPKLTPPTFPAAGKLTPAGFSRVAFAGDRYAALNGDGKYGFWDPNGNGAFGGDRKTDPTAFPTVTTDITFAPDRPGAGGVDNPSNLFAAANTDGTVLIWDMSQRIPVVRLTNLGGPVARLSFTPDGKGLATVERTGRVRIWADLTVGPHSGPPVEVEAP